MPNQPDNLKAVLDSVTGKVPTEWELKQRKRLKMEQLRRECEALRLYEPLPFQEEFHKSTTQTVVMRKANQVGGEQPYTSGIITPQGKTTMGELSPGDVILGGDGLPCVVEAVQEYGNSPVYRLVFSDGTSCEAGENHKWTCRVGSRPGRPRGVDVSEPGWRVHTTREILDYVERYGYQFGLHRGASHYRVCFPVAIAQFAERDVPIDPYTLGVLIGDGNFTHWAVSVTSCDEEVVEEMALPVGCKVRKLVNKSTASPERYGKASLYGISGTKWHDNPLSAALEQLGLRGKRGHEKYIPECYLRNSVEVRLGVLQGLLDTDGSCGGNGNVMFYTTSHRLAGDITDLARSLGGRASIDWRKNSHNGKPGRPLAHICIVLPPELNPFRLPRKRDRRAQKLKHKFRHFRYLQKIEYVGIKPCRCIKVGNESLTYLTDDYIVTHNTLAGAVEVARALTNSDPYGKYPATDGVVACLGYGEKHIGKTFYAKLFKSGAFDIIKDKKTGKWRAYRPWPEADGGDLEREAEKKPAPPLIPQRFIKEIAWEKRSERIFSVVRLTTGWELWAFNSAGDPGQAQGFQCKLYWVDEDVATAGWIAEILFRILKNKGYLRWTAVPHAKNDEMLKLLDAAEKQGTSANPTVKLIAVTAFQNKYISNAELLKTIETAKALGDDVYRQRILGEININSTLMYPMFSRRVHDVMNVSETSSQAQQILAERMGEPPDDWTRYASIDPGYNICAIEFLAVPPPELGNQVFLYDECYLHEATAETFGDAMAMKCADRVFEAFILDMHGGRLRSIGSGELPVDKYRDALRDRGVKSESTGHGFRHACDDRKRREEDMRLHLGIQRTGHPRLMVVAGKCSSFCWEMERFKKKIVKQWGSEVPTDEGDRRVNTHAIEAVEGALSLDLPYIKPRIKHAEYNLVDRWNAMRERLKFKRRMQGQGASNHISLGPLGVG